jgi:hypothetical protein
MLQQVRLGQVRKARKSSIIRPPLLSMSIFQNSEKNRGGVRWWKNRLRGLFKQVRLGQVRKAIKSWKSKALGPPIHSLTCFGRKFERTVFERTTSSLFISLSISIYISLSLCLSVSTSLCLFVYPYIHLFVPLSISIYVSLSLCLSVSTSLCLFVYLYLRLFVSLSISIYVSLFICSTTLSLLPSFWTVICSCITSSGQPVS